MSKPEPENVCPFNSTTNATSNSASKLNVKPPKAKLPVTGRLTYFLGGMGLTFAYLYFNFMDYMNKSDQALKKDIEEIKQMIENQNREAGRHYHLGEGVNKPEPIQANVQESNTQVLEQHKKI